MKELRFEDINLLDVGIKYQTVGTVFSGANKTFLVTLPHKHNDIGEELEHLKLTPEQMERFSKQLDMQETEIYKNNQQIKVIVRKCQRQIDAAISWAVFKRDNYHCRYCDRDGIPLSVDHVDLWELGGATVEDNLLTSCKKCNKVRGSLEFEEWLKSSRYIKTSENLSQDIKNKNMAVALDLPRLKKMRFNNQRSR